MSSDLEQFKIKIASYTLEQLEEVLISLNKDKFPEKYQIVRETLSNKKGGHFSNPSENLMATVVDDSRSSPALSVDAPISLPLKPLETLSSPPKALSIQALSIQALSIPVHVTVQPPISVVSDSSVSGGASLPSEVPSEVLRAIPKPNAQSANNSIGNSKGNSSGLIQWCVLTLVILTSLTAGYCLLLPALNLPGKAFILDVAHKLPDLPFLKDSDLQQSADRKSSSTSSSTGSSSGSSGDFSGADAESAAAKNSLGAKN